MSGQVRSGECAYGNSPVFNLYNDSFRICGQIILFEVLGLVPGGGSYIGGCGMAMSTKMTCRRLVLATYLNFAFWIFVVFKS